MSYPVLLKTSITSGKIDWTKQFVSSEEVYVDSSSTLAINDIQLKDQSIWFRIYKLDANTPSKLIKVDSTSGSVESSFQFANSQTGFSLNIVRLYYFANEILAIANSDVTTNSFGVSSSSQQDVSILKLDLASQQVTQSSVCDMQNGFELTTSIELYNGYVYQFGIQK
mmetsp:Transcript_29492/g.33788  ORF Transcript_29492/g.33788 Transcript_29492/m.33788 type:complete len:168 (-) Transcript_29492:464-967(-)